MSGPLSTLDELEAQVALNPYDEKGYLTVLDRYEESCDNEDCIDDRDAQKQQKLESLRVQYALYCNPPLSFWTSWLTDCVIVANRDKSFIEKMDAVFDQAMRHAPHDDIVCEYLDAMQSYHEKEDISDAQMRKAFETCLEAVGGDILTANAVWARYRSFELDETQDIMEITTDHSSIEVQEAKKRVIGVYRRNLALPLIGIDAVLQEFDHCLGDICSESDIHLINPADLSKAYSISVEKKETRLTFEENVTAPPAAGVIPEILKSRLHSWQAYLDFEIKDKQLSRAQRLYERALLDCVSILSDSATTDDEKEMQTAGSLMSTFWEDYTHFAANVIQDYRLLECVTSRAVKCSYCWSNINLWRLRFLALEVCDSLNFKSPFALPSLLSKVSSSTSITDCNSKSGHGGGMIGPAPGPSPETGPAIAAGGGAQSNDGHVSGSQSITRDEDSSTISMALATLQRAMQCGRFTQDDSFHYIALLMMYCDVYKHQLASSTATEAETATLMYHVQVLRDAFAVATGYMQGYFDTWAEGWLVFVAYKAKIEDTVIEDAASAINDGDDSDGNGSASVIESSALEEYEHLLKKFCATEATSITHVSIWLHYLTFLTEESGTRDVSFCRKVYKRAVSLCTATIMQSQSTSYLQSSFVGYGHNASPGDLLYNHWQTFETRCGEVKNVLYVMNRYRKYSLKLAAAVANSMSQTDAKKHEKSSFSAVASKKRSVAGDEGDSACDGRSHQEAHTTKRSKTTEQLSNASASADTVQSQTNVDVANMGDCNAGERMYVAEKNIKESVIIPGKYSIFVKNIDFLVTQQDLENLFKANKYSSGSVNPNESPTLVVRLAKTAGGKSRGMAHVDFSTPEHLKQALHLHNTVLRGRPITVEKFVPSAYTIVDAHPLTVFLKNMTRDTSELDIKTFLLGVLGMDGGGENIIAAVKIMKCKRSGNSKGQALVQFTSSEYVAKCIAAVNQTSQQLHDKKVLVAKSKFPAIVEGESAAVPSIESMATSTPSVKKTAASFKPRRVMMKPSSVSATAKPKLSQQPASSGSNSSNPSGAEAGTSGAQSNSDFRKFYQ